MPKDITSQIKTMVIAGGDINDPASDHSGNQKLYNPLEHGEDVSLDHLSFSPLAMNPTQAGGQQFPGVMDPGTLVYVLKNVGENGGIIIGQSNSIRNGNKGSGGGRNLMKGKVQELIDRDIGVSIPPQIEESEENGVKIRKIKEKGDKHSLGLLDGLPNHGALFDMSGFRLPELKKVPTAKQTNDQMMTNSIFQQLPGQIMSLAQMFQGLKNNGSGGGTGGSTAADAGGLGGGPSYWDDVHQTLTPEMSAAVNSLSNLIQGHETDNGVGYVTGGVVHYGIYLENAVQLLSEVQTIDDLMYVMSRLQWDTSIMGHEALDNVVVQIENAWGTGLQEVDVNGTITVTYDDANAQSNFANSMSNTTYSSGSSSAPYTPPSSGGSGGGAGGGGQQAAQQIQSMLGNLFGQSAGTLQDMWKRLAPSQEKEATQMHKKLTQEDEPQKQKRINQATIEGGDPLNKVYYQE